MKLIGAALILVGAVACGDNLDPDSSDFAQAVGSENCDTSVTATSNGASVSIAIDEGFNAWKGNAPAVNLTGNSTTCSGTTSFDVDATGGWTWAAGNQQCSTDFVGTADLSVAANHWHNLIHCDGSTEVVGCTGDASYTAMLFVDGPGPNDFSTTVSGSLGAVQDPDVVEEGCGACPIGLCVSQCQAACPQGDTDCGQCCECWCKDEGRESGNAACQPQDLCYSGSEGHAVCLPGSAP